MVWGGTPIGGLPGGKICRFIAINRRFGPFVIDRYLGHVSAGRSPPSTSQRCAGGY